MKLGDLLYEFLDADFENRRKLETQILSVFDDLKSPEVDESFKIGFRENLITLLDRNILTETDIQNFLISLAMLKFQ